MAFINYELPVQPDRAVNVMALGAIPKERICAITAKQIHGMMRHFIKGGSRRIFNFIKIDNGIKCYQHINGSVPVFLVADGTDEELIYANRLEILSCVSEALNWSPTVTLIVIEEQSHALERLATCSV